MTRLEFSILGPLEVRADGTALALGGGRRRALLALLLLGANRVVPRDRIVDALWGDEPPPTVANAVQVAVHGLRGLLGAERVLTRGPGYELVVEEGALDLERFERLLERARGESAVDAAQTLREALALVRGPVLEDITDTRAFAAERERIEELVLLGVQARIDADLELGRHAELVPELETLVRAHPYHEGFRADLMLALYRSGRQADALQAYRVARAELVEELGVEPSRTLQELEASILRQDTALDGPPTDARTGGSTVPVPPGPLVGRELELASVTALLLAPGSRLVTLTGPGGTGKTRLALEAAHRASAEFPGGVFLADLAPLGDAALVAPSLARTLGVRDASDDELVERIAGAIGDRETLVLVDNFEHVLQAAPFVAELIARARPLRVLATSREPLRLRAEQEYRVPPLSLPPRAGWNTLDELRRSEALEFFLARAGAAHPAFELTGENAGPLVDICHALDGLPLALELAAARVKLLSPAALRDRLGNRLGLLEDGDRDLPSRQRTLRATIDWSFALLPPEEQRLFARLAVFAGGWTLEAAERACDASLSTLGSLVEKSLARAEHDARGDARFSMLETVREYALERLTASGELDAVRDRHAAYYGDLAVRLQPVLETFPAVEEAAREHANIRVALEHALERREGATALRLCAIARFWYARGYLGEGSAWIERALALEGGDPVTRARVLYVGSTLAWTSGDHERAVARGQEALELARKVGDVLAEMGALTALGLAHQGRGDLERSLAFHQEGLELARRSAHDHWTAIALSNIADLEIASGDHARAEELTRESLEINRRTGDVEGTGVTLLVWASSLLDRGRGAEAIPMIVESIDCFRRVGFDEFLASALVALARTWAPDDPGQAGRLLGAARALRGPLGPAQFVWEQDWAESTEETVRELLGASRAEAELAAGASAPRAVVDSLLPDAVVIGPAS